MLRQIQAQSTTNNSSQQSQAQTTSHFQEIGTNQNHHDRHQQGKITTQASTDTMDVTNMIDYNTIHLFTMSSNLIDPKGCIKFGNYTIAGVIKFLVELNTFCFGESTKSFDTLSKPQTQTLLLKFKQNVIFTELHSSHDDLQSSDNFIFNKAGVYFPFRYWFQRRKVLNNHSLEILVPMRFMLGYYYLVFIIPFTYYWESFPVVTLGLLFFICSLCS
ncbi:hypothetical protein WICANDRAFT_84555 [Wickerhamomyces anomalus NRRL Y-366-8]|uniref:Uncharacterized protein n=1 Tax=Wickerhamomyces anomalus (strain ATCC 58044 / CBS 1984 / NCYC 433 / NRRL Y-366-8) TaxID=683960 RepID=A0A1E3P075_WICAA|nr:uncharacterized protein WICANDRAFT_84555 [Wickerhamomyces anomalus NRRL Y-366-8]ODQ58839.1 hypothetical protein WICANDRAFT_84555 [Wickerhamomyces anomalus NRRL Y-366-8]